MHASRQVQPVTEHGGWLVVDCSAEPGLAALLDDARRLIVEARDDGYEPAGLLIDAKTHRLLVETKARETARGRQLLVLGLTVAPLSG